MSRTSAERMRCIRSKVFGSRADQVYRVSAEEARARVETGEWCYTSKGAWKATGREYLHQTAGSRSDE